MKFVSNMVQYNKSIFFNGGIRMEFIESSERMGNIIKEYRTIKNISLDGLALKTGISKSTLQRYEKGKSIPLDKFQKITVALEVDPGDIIWEVSPSDSEKEELYKHFIKLNAKARKIAIERIEELTKIKEYTD